MARRGNPYDNAMMESFMKTLKVAGVDPMAFESADEVAEHLLRFIDSYNERRLHSALGYLSPNRFEAEVLAGLSRPLPALSVEFVAGRLDLAAACIGQLAALGSYEFNAVPGEGRRFVFDAWVPGGRVREWLAGGAGGASSGDLYARLAGAGDAR